MERNGRSYHVREIEAKPETVLELDLFVYPGT